MHQSCSNNIEHLIILFSMINFSFQLVTASAGICGAIFGLVAEHAGLIFIWCNLDTKITDMLYEL